MLSSAGTPARNQRADGGDHLGIIDHLAIERRGEASDFLRLAPTTSESAFSAR